MERKIYQHNRHFITLNSRTRRLHSLTPNAYRPPCLISHLATNHFPQLFHFLMLVDLAKLHQAFQSSIKTKEGAKAVIEYIAKNPRLFSQLQHKDFMNYTILKRRKLSKWRGSMHSERSEWERISWDIDRTHLWICRSLQQIDSMRCFLRRVIYRISAQLDRFSYVQGFHCIIRAMYQLRLNEQQAYMLGCYFLRQLKLNGYYENRMEKMREICYAFDVYVFNYLPELHQCLKRQDLSAQCYALSWFVTLYSQQLHAPVLSRLWVLFLLKGWKVMIKFGVALLCLFQSSLIQKNQDQLAESLRQLQSQLTYAKQRQLWQLYTSIKVTNKMLSYLSRQMHNLQGDKEISVAQLKNMRDQASCSYQELQSYQSYSLPSYFTIGVCCQKVEPSNTFPYCHDF